jgi:hypothetical protein
MLRTSMIALAAATVVGGFALGSTAASAVPIVAVQAFESGMVQPVWYRPYYHPVWYRPYYHRYWWHRHHHHWW